MEKNTGGYDLEGVIWHQHSNRLMLKILELWTNKDRYIFDLGCGHNFYSNVLNYAGYMSRGMDHVPLNGVDIVGDITKPLNLKFQPISNVISLEVGEHIPDELSGGYLDNLTSFGGDIIMSWAVPGQAGIGHINCRPLEWVTSKMFDRGYILDREKTDQLRACVQGCHCTWFQNTLMYFKPKT